ncbi:hypothetical protein [Natrarchaeobius chitinivorans]|uniref:Uncharacterized protein n=1 Tax=Natrarchaeobius chitinivorans TaxID=1679083 RepID=A0A3N6MKK7_NATCH|nr:hypothetical protein [Natrarchaeobius chitinivorans]RQG94816.1 hypothetical protein EA473_09945 [Natrarchaeobius chitinivorans]
MTDLEQLPRTDNEYVRKDDSVQWLRERSEPTSEEIVDAITPKPYGQKGKTFNKSISDVRIKGDAEFVETIAGLLKAFVDCESMNTRLDIQLQKVKHKETGEPTDAWSLYLKSAERGSGRQP